MNLPGCTAITERGLVFVTRLIWLRLFRDAGTLPAWDGSAEFWAETMSLRVPSWGEPMSSSFRVLASLVKEGHDKVRVILYLSLNNRIAT